MQSAGWEETREEPVFAPAATQEEAQEIFSYFLFRDQNGKDLVALFNSLDPVAGSRVRFVREHMDEIRAAMKKSEVPGVDEMNGEAVKQFFLKAIRYDPNKTKTVTDTSKRDAFVEQNAEKEGYSAWIDGLLDGLIEKKGIYNGKDMFYPSGKRRSWEQRHYEYNLENIVRAMYSTQEAQGAGFFGNNLFGSSAQKYDSVDAIRSDKDRLRTIDDEAYENLKSEYVQRLGNIADMFARDRSDWRNREAASDLLLEAVMKRRTRDGIAAYLKNEGAGWTRYSDAVVDSLIALVEDVRKMPTGYFEAKPARPVYADEIKGVVLPESSDVKLLDALDARGISYLTYENKNDADRIEKVNQLADEKQVKFSQRNDTEYMTAVQNGDMETAQRMVDEAAKQAGYPIRAYHGTGRGDRVGNVFLPERATSGPMAFFTDNKNIAESYAKNKADTSIAYDSDFDQYETQFRIKTKYQDMPLYKAWGYLDRAAQNRIIQKAGQLRINWDGNDELMLDSSTNEANGGFQWQLKQARGNAIYALVDQWLNSAILFDEERRFLDVLEMAGVTEEFRKRGMDTLYFKDPNEKHEKVYDVYLGINKPFDATKQATEQFADDFLSWYDMQDVSKYERKSVGADMLDKNNIDAETFAERIKDDAENQWTHAWTSIPDSMTDYLKSLGYDGIKDTGGKYGGDNHIVWIPFLSEQVKSAEPVTYDDAGNVIPLSERFNETKGDIRYSTRQEVLARDDVDWMDDFSSIRKQLNKHRDGIAEMDPVVSVNYGGEVKTDLEELILQQVKNVGGERFNRDRLSFNFDEQGIHNIVTHARTDELRAAALAAPYVAKRGKIISGHKDHEHNNTTTLTFAAPAIIDGEQAHVGVVIQFTNDGRAHAVNVEFIDATSDGQKKKPARGLRSRTSHTYVSDLLTNADSNRKNTTESEKRQVKSSLRDQSAVSDRELLSGALMEAAQTEDERARLKRYQADIDVMTEMQERLDTINSKLRELSAIKDKDARTEAAKEAYGLTEIVPPKSTIAETLRQFSMTQNEEIAEHAEEIRDALVDLVAGKKSYSDFFYTVQKAVDREVKNAGHYEAPDSFMADAAKEMRGAKIYLSPEDYAEVAESFGGAQAFRRQTFGKLFFSDDRSKASRGLDEFYDEMRAANIGLPESTSPTEQVENLLSYFDKTHKEDLWVQENLTKEEAQKRSNEVTAEIAIGLVSDSDLSLVENDRGAKNVMNALRSEGAKLANRINIYDKRLLRLEATKPLKAVVAHERKTARTQALQQAKQRQVEAVQKTKSQYEERLTKLRKQKNEDFSSEFSAELSQKIGELADAIGDTPRRSLSAGICRRAISVSPAPPTSSTSSRITTCGIVN